VSQWSTAHRPKRGNGISLYLGDMAPYFIKVDPIEATTHGTWDSPFRKWGSCVVHAVQPQQSGASVVYRTAKVRRVFFKLLDRAECSPREPNPANAGRPRLRSLDEIRTIPRPGDLRPVRVGMTDQTLDVPSYDLVAQRARFD